jgi:hypothetical protein
MSPRAWLLVIILGFGVLLLGGGMERANRIDAAVFGGL